MLSGFANAVAALAFLFFGPVRWLAVLPLAAGFLLGGRVGPSIMRAVPAPFVRAAVAAGGVGLAVVLGWQAYR